MAKQRIDQLICQKGLVETRTKAQALILSGLVFVREQRVEKPGTLVDEAEEIKLVETFPYVSRGALKIEQAYKKFKLDFKDKIICDIGSSTGGFSDFALSHGAKKIYAIDVGRGQLASKVRENTKVVVMEETDFRTVASLPERVDFFLCDVSFISLRKIIPHIKKIKTSSSHAVLLVKPQFEAGKKEVDQGKGVIKDRLIQEKVLAEIKLFAQDQGFKILGETISPIKGAKGNIEYLLWLG